MRPATCDHLGAAPAADLIRSSQFDLSGEAVLAADLIRSSKFKLNRAAGTFIVAGVGPDYFCLSESGV